MEFKALRICRKCGIQANNSSELSLFVKSTNDGVLYNRRNICKKCANKRNLQYNKPSSTKYRDRREYYRIRAFINKDKIKHYRAILRGTANKKRTGKCETCGAPSTSVHHIIPRWFNDDDSESNLIEVCSNCHRHLEMFVLYFLSGKTYSGRTKNHISVNRKQIEKLYPVLL